MGSEARLGKNARKQWDLTMTCCGKKNLKEKALMHMQR
jgi:hypothetical protein